METSEFEGIILDANSEIPLYIQPFIVVKPSIDYKKLMHFLIAETISSENVKIKDEKVVLEIFLRFNDKIKNVVLEERKCVSLHFGDFIPISTCKENEEFDPFYHELKIGFEPNDLFKQFVLKEKFFSFSEN